MVKRKKQKAGKSRVVKVSATVYQYIIRGGRKHQSVDAALRTIFGLKTRKGKAQKLRQFWLLRKGGLAVFDRLGKAKGESILRAVSGDVAREEVPTKVREVK